jgi:uncharacterized protein YoaH (UPF0181 family)
MEQLKRLTQWKMPVTEGKSTGEAIAIKAEAAR